MDCYVSPRTGELGEDKSCWLGKEQGSGEVFSTWERTDYVCRAREGCQRKGIVKGKGGG